MAKLWLVCSLILPEKEGMIGKYWQVVGIIALVGGWLLGTELKAQEEDIRISMDSRNYQVAQLTSRSIELAQSRQLDEAMRLLERAVQMDPDCAMAWFWLSLCRNDTGDLEGSIRAGEEVVNVGKRRNVMTNVQSEGAVNLALNYARIGKHEDAVRWFSQAMLIDPKNTHGLLPKAYRNLAISYHEANDPNAACIAAVQGASLDPIFVKADFVETMIQGAMANGGDVADILDGGFSPPLPPVRSQKPELSALPEIGDAWGNIKMLLMVPQQNVMVALPEGESQSKITLFSGLGTGEPMELDLGGPIRALTTTSDRIYASLGNPTRLAEVKPTATGGSVLEWTLDVPSVPVSLAVFPEQDLIFMTGYDRVVRRFNMKTRLVSVMEDCVANILAADPVGRFLFTMEKDAPVGGGMDTFIINGRPVTVVSTPTGGSETTLTRYHVIDGELVVGGVHFNAASNGRIIGLSPDGSIVAPIGGGGYRGSEQPHGAGYGSVAFPIDQFGTQFGFYKCDAYPQGVAIAPTTGLIATASDEKVHVASVRDQTSFWDVETDRKDPFATVAWDATGRFLYVAKEKGGIACFELEQTAEEKTRGTAWVQETEQLASAYRPVSTVTFGGTLTKPQPWVKEFTLESANAKTARDQLADVMREGRSTLMPLGWQYASIYAADPVRRGQIAYEFGQVGGAELAGTNLYRIKELRAKYPSDPVIANLEARNLLLIKRYDEAFAAFMEALRFDEGRTNATFEAFRGLGELRAEQGKPDEAAAYYAAAIRSDPYHPRIFSQASATLAQVGLEAELERLHSNLGVASSSTASMANNMNPPASVTPTQPATPVAAPAGITLTPEQIHQRSVSSIVYVRTENGSGTGACIRDDGLIVTNFHVVGGAQVIYVYPYAETQGQIRRLEPVKVNIAFSSEQVDLAFLKPVDPVNLTALPLADQGAVLKPGARVYAIGSPGAAEQALDLSLTDGLVSSADRKVGQRSYIQHSASINPGNSGGPLLNTYGQIVGINTLKAEMESVGFAVKADQVRAALNLVP